MVFHVSKKMFQVSVMKVLVLYDTTSTTTTTSTYNNDNILNLTTLSNSNHYNLTGNMC